MGGVTLLRPLYDFMAWAEKTLPYKYMILASLCIPLKQVITRKIKTVH